MKKVFLSFLVGLFVGLVFPSIHFGPHTHTLVEESLGQIVYERLSEYQNEIDLDKVLRLAKDFASHKRSFKEEKELYAPLMALAENKAERDATLLLEKAETYLQELQKNPKIQVIVPHRVFMEIIQEGRGDVISATDPVTLSFREYATDGTVVKDTSDKTYTIPLSQTIKGFQLGLSGAKVGETRKLYIHPEYGFGKMGRKAPNKLLIYEVTVYKKY